MSEKKRNSHNLTQKTLDVMELLSVREHGLSLQEIAQGVGLPPATAYRILCTLKEARYVSQMSNKDYFLTYKLYVLMGRAMEHDPFMDRVLPFLNYFVKKHESISGVSVTTFCEDACVNLISVGRDLKFRTRELIPGASHPCHCTAAGKVFLASLSEQQLEQWLSRNALLPYTKSTLVDEEELKRELAKTRERGYGITYGELINDLAVISLPVRETNGQVDLALNFSIVMNEFSRINNPEFVQSVRELLKRYHVF